MRAANVGPVRGSRGAAHRQASREFTNLARGLHSDIIPGPSASPEQPGSPSSWDHTSPSGSPPHHERLWSLSPLDASPAVSHQLSAVSTPIQHRVLGFSEKQAKERTQQAHAAGVGASEACEGCRVLRSEMQQMRSKIEANESERVELVHSYSRRLHETELEVKGVAEETARQVLLYEEEKAELMRRANDHQLEEQRLSKQLDAVKLQLDTAHRDSCPVMESFNGVGPVS